MLAKWKRGFIDEEWKLKIAEANRQRAITVLTGLNSIVFGSNNPAPAAQWFPQTNLLRGLTGAQIADALDAYWTVNEADLVQGRARFPQQPEEGNERSGD